MDPSRVTCPYSTGPQIWRKNKTIRKQTAENPIIGCGLRSSYRFELFIRALDAINWKKGPWKWTILAVYSLSLSLFFLGCKPQFRSINIHYCKCSELASNGMKLRNLRNE